MCCNIWNAIYMILKGTFTSLKLDIALWHFVTCFILFLLFGWIKTSFLFLQFSLKLFHKFHFEINSELSFWTCFCLGLVFKYKKNSGKRTPKFFWFLVLFPDGRISNELMKNLIESFIRKHIISGYKNLAPSSFCHFNPLQRIFNSENCYWDAIEWSVTIVAKCRDKFKTTLCFIKFDKLNMSTLNSVLANSTYVFPRTVFILTFTGLS